MRLRLQGFAFGVALALVGSAPAAGSSLPGTPVPNGFVGVNLDGPPLIPQDNVSLGPQFDQMQSSGVQTVRTAFDWAVAQPYQSWSDVPSDQLSVFDEGVGDVPTDYRGTDTIVAEAAAHGMTLVPTVIYTPSWDAGKAVGNSLVAPRQYAPYGEYLQTLIHRYGSHGTFWQANPGLTPHPIRMWEIWNEPWIPYYWPIQPFLKSYLLLLRDAHSAVKSADPGAKVVLGGMPNASWGVLQSVYRVPGARGLFDVVDIHAYTKYPSGVITILRHDRSVMTKAGDGRKPIILGEMGWTSSLHQTHHAFDWETTPAGQASNVRTVLSLLAANRRKLGLAGFYWYTWMGDQYRGASPWNFSGLLGYHSGRVWDKSALAAFRQLALALEHRG